MDIKSLKLIYGKRKKEIKSRLKEFENQEDHFYELCFCLLTPQSNAYRCAECINLLKDNDFINREFEIASILRKYTRFHNNKARYLVKIRKDYPQIHATLDTIKEPVQKREYLVKNVKGLGMKEASHYLRNIGYKNLAILDRHILKNLQRLNVIDELPKSLTKKVYLDIEAKFLQFSKKISIPMDELDLLFWSMQTGKIFK